MGFCRRCGEIVAGDRCKCGGLAVAPVVPWSQSQSKDKTTDKWSKTYIHRERSASPTRPLMPHLMGSAPSASTASPNKRFPQPGLNSNVSTPVMGSRVSAHIASATSHNRSPSPLKYSNTLPDPDSDILPSLAHQDATLSKVYGSVLQSKESLTTHSCAICSSTFPPDATIYPDPVAADSSRFLCRPCFTANGGSKGPCTACSRPVLILKSEGGFIEAAEKYWHKQCFNCSGCSKNIAESPTLDLFGNPSCAECFDNCLRRGPSTPKKPLDGRVNNIGGMNINFNSRINKEGSPAVEELEQRLGIPRGRENSPAPEESSRRLSIVGNESPSRSPASDSHVGWPLASNGGASSPLVERRQSQRNSSPYQSPARKYSPVGKHTTGSPASIQEAIEEMKQKFFKESPRSSVPRTPRSSDHADLPATRLRSPSSPASNRSRPSFSSESLLLAFPLSPIIPQTPDMLSDTSDMTTQSSSSGLDSPPRNDGDFSVSVPFRFSGHEQASYHVPHDIFRPHERLAEEASAKSPSNTPKNSKLYDHTLSSPSGPSDSVDIPLMKTKTLDDFVIPHSSTPEPTTSARCAKCGGKLFSIREGGRFVTVPKDGDDAQASMYHTDCFKCVECRRAFKETNMRQAVFVRSKSGPCHVECAPATKITFRKSPSLTSLKSTSSDITTMRTASPPISTPSYASSSRLDRLPIVTPTTVTSFPRFGSRTTCPGCHRSVSPMEWGVVPGPQGTRWHTGCLICGGKATVGESPRQVKKKRKGEPGCGKKLDSAAKSSEDGGVWCRECWLLLGETRMVVSQMPAHTASGRVATQSTGTTTIARQFTGIGVDSGLLRQLTGGTVSLARSISPTKQLGMMGGSGTRPRPKSVVGMRNTKSIDEGRGMFLVRQLTGASGV